MPIYEFECERCGARFDQLMSMKDPTPGCPSCDGDQVRKLVSAAGFVLKGGGWYKDHYGLKGSSSSSSEPAKTEAPKTETKTEKKPEKASVAA